MLYSKTLLLLLFCFLFTACGQQGFNGKKKISLTRETLHASLKNQNFECASVYGGTTCPSGIARLFIYNPQDPGKSSVCSGFLNGSNQLVTNNHCVANQKECSETHVSIYDGTSYQIARCKNIIKTAVDPGLLNQKSVDYTVMELDKILSIRPLPLAPFSPLVGETLTAWVIDHLTLTDARITELSCTYRGLSRSMQLSHCPTIQGNSGSPVLNSLGEVVGVLWGSTVDDEIDASFPLDQRRDLKDYSFVTELRHFKRHLVIPD